MDDLVERDGLYYKKFTNVPFTGSIEGEDSGNILNGKKDGDWFSYWQDGQLSVAMTYRDGTGYGDYKGYHSNGTLKVTGQLDNEGNMDGQWLYYSRTGLLTNNYNYRHGALHGSFLTWFENGQPKEDWNFYEGKKHGKFRTWNYQGEVVEMYTGYFENGRKVSD
jgi:antitoxin component YwqK of YwqJK toxin-antitoxin module